jgi:hypothetical protein
MRVQNSVLLPRYPETWWLTNMGTRYGRRYAARTRRRSLVKRERRHGLKIVTQRFVEPINLTLKSIPGPF